MVALIGRQRTMTSKKGWLSMATQEINLVLSLVEKGASAVEKETHILWTRDDLLEAQFQQRFHNEDRITEPKGDLIVSSLYPGCPNMIGNARNIGSGEPIAETS